jgi:hypothetical protein
MPEANASPRVGGLGVTHCEFCGRPAPLDEEGWCVECRRVDAYRAVDQANVALAAVEAAVRVAASYAHADDVRAAVQWVIADRGGGEPDTLEEMHGRLRKFIDLGEEK